MMNSVSYVESAAVRITTVKSTSTTVASKSTSSLKRTTTTLSSSTSSGINTISTKLTSSVKTVASSSTTTTTTTSSTASSATSSSIVVGCYADFYPSSRAMSDASTTSTSNTPATCAAFCTSLGIPYSGTEYANECYCSTTSPTTVSTACTMACTGDSTQICGGANALSVVYTTIPTLPATNSTKRGLCWPWNNPASSFAFFSPSAIPWLYNWELWDPRSAGTYSTAEYVPMCRTQAEASQVSAYFSSCYANYLLGFNEPDLPSANGGDYLSPYNASILWKQYIQPVKASCGTALGAPAVTNGVGSGWGTDWLRQFFGNCTSPSCSFDFIPFHWYGTSLSDFETYVTNFHSLFPTYPLWITEWQFTGISSTTTAYLEKQALQWLDAQNYVARYAMFGPMNSANMAGITNGAMITDDLSGLTNVGKIYAGLM
ncbi:unnamed protein product [Rotaria sp. Silwood1]|nr:unnamed protein product [Rotaria sp. Silwood1]CAF1516579.1 unnamed protein product [Rotaria sp. Silwood1]CAF3601973.1 unnamed protein product [Rotaria sp. Silwood1]CAF4683911.1 unnamed protein product [Rotaria sp. Silwood1]